MSDYVSGRKALEDGTRERSSIERGTSSYDMSVDEGSAEGSLKCKGKEKASVKKSPDEFSEYKCDPCSSAGDQSEAEGYCTECEEYLCDICFKSHSSSKATRNHRLLNKVHMPRKSCKTCNPCKSTGEEIEAVGYCWECEEYLCSSCFRSHSRSKATKSHYLIDKDKMPVESESDIASSIAKVDIQDGDSGYKKYDEKYSYERNIKVKGSWREKQCYIVAMTLLSSTELVLADADNKSLKLVDIERNTLKKSLDLKSPPYSITTVSEVQVAVSLYELRLIQIITVAGKLSVHRNIQLSSPCLDIVFLNGKLYASFPSPVTFKILLLSGTVHKTIKPDSKVLKNCTIPANIAVNSNGSLIYVSDWKSNTVLIIAMDGTMLYKYQDELTLPQDITISPFGSVYLSMRGQNALYKMTPDLKDAVMILGPGDMPSPFAMCFSAEKQHLYISSGSTEVKDSNYIKVFKWQ